MTMTTSFCVIFCLLGFVKMWTPPHTTTTTYTTLTTITTIETRDTIELVVDDEDLIAGSGKDRLYGAHLADLNYATKNMKSYTTDLNSPSMIENLVIEDDEDLSEGSGQTNAYADLYTTRYEARYTTGYKSIPTDRYSTGYTTEYTTVASLRKGDLYQDDVSISNNNHVSSSSLFTCSKLTIICVFAICCIFGYVVLAIINNLDSAKNKENAAHLSRKSQTVIIGENP